LFVDGKRRLSCRQGFFLPVNVLARLFRRLFVQGLARAYEQSRLSFHSASAYSAWPLAFNRPLDSLRARE